MLRSAKIRNFRSLQEVDLTLGPLTVLVGPNASGKSSILSALDGSRGLGPRDAWRHREDLMVSVVLTTEGRGAGRWSREYRERPAHAQSNGPFPLKVQALRLEPRGIGGSVMLKRCDQLDAEGAELANVFATLARKQQDAIARNLAEVLPSIGDVVTRPTNEGTHRLEFEDRWQEGVWYEPKEVSEGTLLLLAYLTLPYQPVLPDLVTIEEPERGLHPYLLGKLMEVLRGLSGGAHGRPPVQIVLATQSAGLLDLAEPEEVRFVSRRADGAVDLRPAPVGDEHWRTAYERDYERSMAQLWLSGALGGVPGTYG